MTLYTVAPAGSWDMPDQVHPVVVGGQGDREATGGWQVAAIQFGWDESAVALVEGHDWVYDRVRGSLTGRLRADPEDSPRLWATRTSFWVSRHDVHLEGSVLQVEGGGSGPPVWTAGPEPIGRSGQVGKWSPSRTLDVRDDVVLRHVVFMLWLDAVFAGRRARDTTPGSF